MHLITSSQKKLRVANTKVITALVNYQYAAGNNLIDPFYAHKQYVSIQNK